MRLLWSPRFFFVLLLSLSFNTVCVDTLSSPVDNETSQFLRSASACPAYRGPAAWNHFLERIKDKVVNMNLNNMVSSDGPNVAVLIEPRQDPCIGLIIRQVFHYLTLPTADSPSPSWRLHIFHGPDNLEFIKAELEESVDPTCSNDTILNKVTFTDLSSVVSSIDAAVEVMNDRVSQLQGASNQVPHLSYSPRNLPEDPAQRWPTFLIRKWEENRAVMDSEIAETGLWNMNRFVYSQVLLDAKFWEAVPAENVLVFQTDAVLCRGGINSYLQFDYIGAPWYLCDSMFGGKKGSGYLCEAGNGGLSLRKKSVMLRQIRNQLRSLIMEDYQIASWFYKKPGSGVTPSFSEARDIFVETVDTTSPDVVPLGTHKPWAANYNVKIANLLSRCASELQK